MSTPSSADSLHFEFNPLIQTYIFWYVAFVMLVSIIGIVLLPFWLFGLGQWYSKHYFKKLECELSTRTLRFKKGIIFQFEKTIPLENIQDMTFTEGPLLRKWNLSIIRIETAGHNVHDAANMSLIGIVNAHAFRQALLDRREALQHAPSNNNNPLQLIAEKLSAIQELLENRLPGNN
jgi:putative membrane protein